MQKCLLSGDLENLIEAFKVLFLTFTFVQQNPVPPCGFIFVKFYRHALRVVTNVGSLNHVSTSLLWLY